MFHVTLKVSNFFIDIKKNPFSLINEVAVTAKEYVSHYLEVQKNVPYPGVQLGQRVSNSCKDFKLQGK